MQGSRGCLFLLDDINPHFLLIAYLLVPISPKMEGNDCQEDIEFPKLFSETVIYIFALTSMYRTVHSISSGAD